jgi:alcohol dehydrogenase (cytochrome c)/quinohemoprotein ethanol dehydrogenase
MAIGDCRPLDAADRAANVDAARLAAAEGDGGNWLSYGRTYSEQRFSPLTRITAANAKNLGLAWYADFDTNRGQEATPLVIDGVMYVSTAWSMVRAFDARTGRPLWKYDPGVPRALGVKGCCDVVNRGVAAWEGKIYVGTFDGRLVALDAATGKPVWSVSTVDPGTSYTVTMAPRVVKGRVIIGNSGSEYGVRGYLSAYDARTGALDWRFYTVPGDPSKPFENKAMAEAAKTWSGEWWKAGGGGTVWEGISFDPKLNLIYFGTGNGSEWNQAYRSAGRGDNLFLASIIAVDADSGAYVWHYQATPGEEWDYDAVQQLILADLSIGGISRPVLMQANKNGFFYVLDRKTGQLLSADAFTTVTWAAGIDGKTGRPVERVDSRYDKTGGTAQILPGALGAHSWQAMAFNPGLGLVFIPAQEIGMSYTGQKNFTRSSMGWNLGVATRNLDGVKGYLSAWDPVKRREVWRVNHGGPWNGGVLTTAGNLVVQGNATGEFAVYRADTGSKVWSMSAQTPLIAAPITYEVDGEQYLAVLGGWGGAYPLLEGRLAKQSGDARNISRVMVFKLDGTVALPPIAPLQQASSAPLPGPADAASVLKGETLFGRYCSVCHGQAAVAGGELPDLRQSPYLPVDAWYAIVLDGALQLNGMASFSAVLDRSGAAAIRDYVIDRAMLARAATRDTAPRPNPVRGAIIAAQGGSPDSPACALCHAFSGAGDSSGVFPRIAGQSAVYLAEQLRAFASGVRRNAIMSPIAATLTTQDLVDVAAYYAASTAPVPPLALSAPAALLSRGRELASVGDPTKELPACAACHGASGAGESPTIPYLGGQYGDYLAFELQMWQRGFRTTSLEAMALFASRLSAQDVAAVAAYYQQAGDP